MSVPGFSDVECACGCENLIPLRAFERGWKYLRGHKPQAAKPVGGAMRKLREKPGAVVQASYALTLEMVRENLTAMAAVRADLKRDWEAAADEVKRLNDSMVVCEARIVRLEAAEAILQRLIDDGSRLCEIAAREGAAA